MRKHFYMVTALASVVFGGGVYVGSSIESSLFSMFVIFVAVLFPLFTFYQYWKYINPRYISLVAITAIASYFFGGALLAISLIFDFFPALWREDLLVQVLAGLSILLLGGAAFVMFTFGWMLTKHAPDQYFQRS